MKKSKDNWLAIIILIFLTACIFRNYFFKNYVPFPSNLLVSFYSPWKFYNWQGYPNGPANKPIGFDNLKNFFPFRKVSLDQIKNKQWPLWNPFNFSGNVLLGTYQSAIFYPFNLLYLILPQIEAWSILVMIQPVLAGFFMYLFLKELNLSKKSSLWGCLAFAFSGWMIAWMEEGLVVEQAALYLPLLLYAIEKIKQKKSWGCGLLILAVIFSITAGFLQTTLYIFLTAIIWAFFRLRENFKQLLTIFFCFIIGLLISAVQILPAVEAYLNSPRGGSDIKFLFEGYLVKPWEIIRFLVPDFWGNPGSYNYFGPGFYHERIFFVGLPIFLLAIYGWIVRKTDSTKSFFAWFSLLTLSLGFFPLGWLFYYSHLPFFSTMIPTRIFLLSTFGLCVLSAYGIEFFLKEKINPSFWKKILIVAGFFFFTLWIFVIFQRFTLNKNNVNYAMVSFKNLILPSLIYLVFSFLVFFSIYSEKLKKLFFYVVLTLSLFSAFYFANKYLYFSERKFIFPNVPVISKLQEISGLNRIWGYGNGDFLRNFNAYYSLYSADGYEGLFSKRYGELLNLQNTNGKIMDQIGRSDAQIKEASERDGVMDNWHRERLMSLLGIKYITETKIGEEKEWLATEKRFPQEFFNLIWEDDRFRIWDYKKSLPRFFTVLDYKVETDRQKMVDLLFSKELNLSKTLLLEEKPLCVQLSDLSHQVGRVVIESYKESEIRLRTEALSCQLLFLSDTYYPGWKAYIDGKETKIYRADYAFRAVEVPAGEHQVIFSYKSIIFEIGLWITLLSLASCIIYLIISLVRSFLARLKR